MKKRNLFLLALALQSGAVGAETPEFMNVGKVTGEVVATPLSKLEKITYSADQTTMTVETTDSELTTPIAEVRVITFGEYKTITSLEETVQDATFALYGKDEIRIDCTDGIRSVKLYNVGGQLLYTTTNDNLPQHVQFSVAALPTGVCVAIVETGKATVSQKIVIR